MRCKKMLCALISAAVLFSLSACDKGDKKAEETTASGDWRNKIEYEGSFYVNKGVKLLYALDKGTITLWDNAGDGKALQTLEYDSTEAGAIESIEITDMNHDGNEDITAVFSSEEGNLRYNLWLWNTKNNNYTYCKIFRTIPNPVISEDGTTVTGTYDSGFFGKLESVYAIDENMALTQISANVSNADEVASNIALQLCSSENITITEGFANIQDSECNVYAVMNGDIQNAYIAFSGDGHWYFDQGITGAYRIIKEDGGAALLGDYVDMAGTVISVCSDLYSCDVSELTVTRVTEGKLITVPVNEEGIPTPYTEDSDVAMAYDNALEAKCFEISRNGEHLCNLARAENTTFYALDPTLTEDSFYRLISAANETILVMDKAMTYDEN